MKDNSKSIQRNAQRQGVLSALIGSGNIYLARHQRLMPEKHIARISGFPLILWRGLGPAGPIAGQNSRLQETENPESAKETSTLVRKPMLDLDLSHNETARNSEIGQMRATKPHPQAPPGEQPACSTTICLMITETEYEVRSHPKMSIPYSRDKNAKARDGQTLKSDRRRRQNVSRKYAKSTDPIDLGRVARIHEKNQANEQSENNVVNENPHRHETKKTHG